jgi:outer membrane protein assembly factor BamB
MLGAGALACVERMLANWPQWRGPAANGLAPEQEAPLRWGRRENIVWKSPLPGLGTSTPILWDDRVFLTCQMGDGPFDQGGQDFEAARLARRSGERQVEFAVQAFARADGKLAWQHRFPAEGELPPVHKKHNLASASCVTDGERVYAWMGNGRTLAFDLAGRVIWQRRLGEEFRPFDIAWGHGSSPVLYKDNILLLCDHPGGAYLLALDKRRGQQRWKADRGDARSYTTPLVAPGPRGDELIVNTSRRLEALDPTTGELLWYTGEPNRVPIGMPVFHDGVLYATRGYHSGPYFAVKTGGRGDVTKTHVLWEVKTGAPYVGSLLYYDGLLYMATERGIVSCVDPHNGAVIWRERLGGCYTSSPVAAGGRIYLFNEDGEGLVLEPGRTLRVLARNRLDERVLASPAVSDGRLFIRTDEHLYCIGGRT